MMIFRCTNCGCQVQRPSQPYQCPQCGRQAVGLFKPIQGGGPPAGGTPYPQAPTPPVAQPYVPPQQPYVPPQPQQPYVPQQPQQPYIPPQAQQPYIPPQPQQPYVPQQQQPYGMPQQPYVPQQPYAPQPVMPQQPVTRLPQPPLPAPPSLGTPMQPPAYAPPPTMPPTQPVQPMMPPAAAPLQPVVLPVQPAAPSVPIATARPVAPEAPVQPTPPPTLGVQRRQQAPQTPPPTPPPQPVQPPPTQRARVTPSPTPPPDLPAREEASRPAAGRATRPTPVQPESPAPPPSRPKQPAASAPPPMPAKEVAKPVAPRPAPQQAAPQPKTLPKPVRPERVVWQFPDVPAVGENVMAMRNAPAVDRNGRVYLHVGDRLVALELAENRPAVCWEYVTGCRTPGPVVVAPDGSIRLHASDGCLHCLHEVGRQAWPPAHVGEPLGYAAPIVDMQGNTWISAYEGGLHRIDVEGRIHQPAPFFRTRQKLNAGGLIHEGVLYIGSEDGYVFAVELGGEKGVNRWNHAGGHGETGWYVHSTPAVSEEGMLVVAGRDENLYGFRLDGTPAWRTPMPGQMLGSPVLDRFGHIYVGVSQSQRGQPPRGLLVCVDGNSHKVRWEYKAAGHVESTAVIGDDDLLYFGDNAGVVHAVDFRGAAQWTVQLDSSVRSAGTILAPGRLAFGLDNETLVVLQCSSQGLAGSGWPKIGRTLGQCGMA